MKYIFEMILKALFTLSHSLPLNLVPVHTRAHSSHVCPAANMLTSTFTLQCRAYIQTNYKTSRVNNPVDSLNISMYGLLAVLGLGTTLWKRSSSSPNVPVIGFLKKTGERDPDFSLAFLRYPDHVCYCRFTLLSEEHLWNNHVQGSSNKQEKSNPQTLN